MQEVIVAHKNYLDMNYSMWENEVDKLMTTLHGVGIDDIPDMMWNDWFKADMDIEEAVQMAIDIVNEGGF